MSAKKPCIYCDNEDTHHISSRGFDCIHSLAGRIAKLEAQLGAATSGVVPVSAADCSGLHTTSEQSITQAGESGSGSAVVPIVSAGIWLGRSASYASDGYKSASDACDLAAVVTRWYERGGRNDSDEADLMDIVGAFCRGEKLPEIPNG